MFDIQMLRPARRKFLDSLDLWIGAVGMSDSGLKARKMQTPMIIMHIPHAGFCDIIIC